MTVWVAAAGACLLIVVVTLPLATASLHRRRRKQEERDIRRSLDRAVRDLYGDHSLSVEVIRQP